MLIPNAAAINARKDHCILQWKHAKTVDQADIDWRAKKSRRNKWLWSHTPSYDFTIRMNGEDWSINENGGCMWIDEVMEDHTTSLFILLFYIYPYILRWLHGKFGLYVLN